MPNSEMTSELDPGQPAQPDQDRSHLLSDQIHPEGLLRTVMIKS